MTDDEMRRLVNDGIERVLNRLTRIEGEVKNLRQEHEQLCGLILWLVRAYLRHPISVQHR